MSSLAGFSLLVVSCSTGTPGPEYAIPGKLCGLELPKKSYAPLFGPGGAIQRTDSLEEMGSFEVRRQGCQFLVDDEPAVSLSGDWAMKNDRVEPSTPREVVAERTRAKPRKYPGAYDVATWRYGAVAAIDCPRPRGDKNAAYSRYLLEVHANKAPLNDDPDRAHEVFGKLAQLAMAEVVKKLPCEGE